MFIVMKEYVIVDSVESPHDCTDNSQAAGDQLNCFLNDCPWDGWLIYFQFKALIPDCTAVSARPSRPHVVSFLIQSQYTPPNGLQLSADHVDTKGFNQPSPQKEL